MPQNRCYSKQFHYALERLAEIQKDPLFAEQLARSVIFQDFLCTLRVYEDEEEKKK